MASATNQTELPTLSPAQRLVTGALAEIPDATVNVLAEASGTSKSTVAKTLLKLETAGAAQRTLHEDGDARLADTWSPTALTGAVLMAAATGKPGYGHADALLATSANRTEPVLVEEPAPESVTEPNGAASCVELQDPDGADTPLVRVADHIADMTEDQPDVADVAEVDSPGGTADSNVGPGTMDDTEGSSKVRDLPVGSTATAVTVAAVVTDSACAGRLAPGALGAMVAAHLLAHPEMDFTSMELSRVLGGKSYRDGELVTPTPSCPEPKTGGKRENQKPATPIATESPTESLRPSSYRPHTRRIP